VSRAYLARVCAGLLLVVAALPGHARADLSYSYVDIIGAPFLQSPVKLLDSTFEGVGVAGTASYAFHDNWSLRVESGHTETDTGNVVVEDPITGEPQAISRIDIDRTWVIVQPRFNYRVAKRTDLWVAAGAIWEDIDLRLTALDPGGALFVQQLAGDDWGFIGGVGVRSMVWKGLELYGDFNLSTVAILDNEIFFNLGARYHLWDVGAITAGVNVSTDSFVAVGIGLRLHYMNIYRRMTD